MLTVLEEYQRQVSLNCREKPGVDRLLHCVIGLGEEAGEVLGVVKKSQFKDRSLDPAILKDEMGDVLWYLSAIASLFGWTVEDLARGSIDKLSIRYPDSYTPLPNS